MVTCLLSIHPSVELLEQLKSSNSSVSSKEVEKILEQARQMVEQMRRQNCFVQKILAEDELMEAQKRELFLNFWMQ